MAGITFEAVSPTAIVCSRCCKALPETAFRRRSKSSTLRMRECGGCHARYERERRRSQRQEAASIILQKSASVIARASNLERLSALLDLLVQQLGGPQKFYQCWLDEIERLKSKRRPTFRLLRFCEMLANAEFLHDAEIHERRMQINAPEWRSSLHSELRQLITKHPEVVIEAAEELKRPQSSANTKSRIGCASYRRKT